MHFPLSGFLLWASQNLVENTFTCLKVKFTCCVFIPLLSSCITVSSLWQLASKSKLNVHLNCVHILLKQGLCLKSHPSVLFSVYTVFIVLSGCVVRILYTLLQPTVPYEKKCTRNGHYFSNMCHHACVVQYLSRWWHLLIIRPFKYATEMAQLSSQKMMWVASIFHLPDKLNIVTKHIDIYTYSE